LEIFIKPSNEWRNILVWDPFMGTGTTGFVCANMKVKFLGSEKDETVFFAAKDRIAQSYMTVDPSTCKELY